MISSKDLFMDEQERMANAFPSRPRKSLFNIRQDHLSLMAIIEENDGELTEEIQASLRLNESEFMDKVISYGFVVKKYEAESDVISNEIKRLQNLKQQADKKAELFKNLIDEGMKQYGHEKVDSELLKISYRKSTPVELTETFTDDILKYADISITLSNDKIKAAQESGETVVITEDMLSLFDLAPCVSKKRIASALKEGIKIPGASMPERKNLQIK